MYVRVTRGRFDPEQADAVEALTSEVAAATKALPGCLAYQGGVNRNAGTVVAISNWEDLSSAEVAREKLGDLVGRILEVIQLEPGEVFEVTVTA
jgi:quinol monooxygenase YgiN